MKNTALNKVVLRVKNDLLQLAIKDRFSGYDPFDGLNSKLFECLPFKNSAFCRLAWIQLHKRSPINFRPWVGISKERNPKGIALFILGLLEDYSSTNNESYLHQAIELGDWLLTQQSDVQQWQFPCWGYHFDWQARAFYVPKGKPNIITTVYVSRALHALGELTCDTKYTCIAYESVYFIVENLLCQHDENPLFSYIPGETAFVHNASLWGAAWVGFVAKKPSIKPI